MQPTDVPQLMLYATKLWPRTFIVPTDERELAMTQQVWMDVLGDLDPDLIRRAMVRWTEHWPPSPRELHNEAVEQLRLEQGIPSAPSLDEAWSEFKDRYRSRGPWSHPAVEAAAQALGCRAFGNSQESEEAIWRSNFIRFYEAAVKRRADADRPLPPILAQAMGGVLKRLDDEFQPAELDE